MITESGVPWLDSGAEIKPESGGLGPVGISKGIFRTCLENPRNPLLTEDKLVNDEIMVNDVIILRSVKQWFFLWLIVVSNNCFNGQAVVASHLWLVSKMVVL